MPRFVILRHEMPERSDRPSHWDFMLEAGDVLQTWALETQPDAVNEQAAQRLADHRLAYLDYEGPITGDRGSVTRWDAGQYEPMEANESRIVADVHGQRLSAQIELTAVGEAQLWRLRIVRRLTRSTSDFSR